MGPRTLKILNHSQNRDRGGGCANRKFSTLQKTERALLAKLTTGEGGANRKFLEGPGGTLVVGPRNGVPLRPPPL